MSGFDKGSEGWLLISIRSTLGMIASPGREVRVSRASFFSITFFRVSREGVAVPSMSGTLANLALIKLRSLAEYRKFDCCLKELSCSSSTITSPRLGIGVKIAERVPRITFASPSFASR